MASGKQTPRQKMINMMYLVLTALLALNISKDILLALTKLDTSLMGTVATVETKNADIYQAFEAAAAENPAKAKEWKDKAFAVKQESDELYNLIAGYKEELIELSGGRDENGQIIALDNKEKPANFLLNEGNAKKLKEQINAYREDLKQYVADNEHLKENIDKTFDTSDKKVEGGAAPASWESLNFEHYPLAAILPFLTDIQAKVRNTETDVISDLQRNIGIGDVKFTGVRAVIVPKSTYVTQGDEYEAEVFLAAYDDTQEPTITVNGSPLAPENIKNGVGFVKFKATSLGEQKWAGMIKIEQLGADPIEKEINGSFMVAPPTAVISPTKMNVLYRGVENPLEIGVPGVDPSKIRVSGNGVSGSNGKYMANVTNVSGKTITITVSVEEEDGVRSIGSKEFRVKGLPPAVGNIYKKNSGLMSKSLIKNATVEAEYQDFPFDLPLTVTSFEVAIPGFPPEQVRGNKMPPEVKTRIDRLRPGQTVSIRDIKASGPKGLRVDRIGLISMDVN